MTQEEYIKLFHKEQLNLVAFKRLLDCDEEVLRLVNRVIQTEREAVAEWIMGKGFATGHGESTKDLLDELEWQITEKERDKFLNALRAFHDSISLASSSNNIRVRGQE